AVRRPLPGGAPVRGRRGAPQRRQVLLLGRLGIQGRGRPARAPQGAAALRARTPHGEELQVIPEKGPGRGTMNLKLIVWRQRDPGDAGRFETYTARNITPDHSFLEMLDVVNEELIREGKEPIAFDHDCREGIC